MIQSSVFLANPYSRGDSYRIHYPIEGTVIRVHFPEDPTNIAKREILYDVEPAVGGAGTLERVPLALGLRGIVDDEDILLQPARLVVPGTGSGQFDVNTHGPASDTDGDRVVVQFINGSFNRPIITHILSHRQRGLDVSNPPKYTGKLERLTVGPAGETGYVFGDGSPGSSEAFLIPQPGERFRHAKMNGTHLAVDSNGDVFVNFKEHPDPDKSIPAGDVAKKFVVQVEGKDLLRVEREAGGNVKVTLGETFAATILAQIGDGAVSVAIAEAIQTWWDTAGTGVKAIFDAHIHPTGVGPSGVTATALPAYDTAITSDKVKIPDNGP